VVLEIGIIHLDGRKLIQNMIVEQKRYAEELI
jgi:hypothetical protein